MAPFTFFRNARPEIPDIATRPPAMTFFPQANQTSPLHEQSFPSSKRATDRRYPSNSTASFPAAPGEVITDPTYQPPGWRKLPSKNVALTDFYSKEKVNRVLRNTWIQLCEAKQREIMKVRSRGMEKLKGMQYGIGSSRGKQIPNDHASKDVRDWEIRDHLRNKSDGAGFTAGNPMQYLEKTFTDEMIFGVQDTLTGLSMGNYPQSAPGNVILDIGPHSIDWSDLKVIETVHDTCVKVRIRSRAIPHLRALNPQKYHSLDSKQIYVLKCPKRRRGVRSLMKELGLLCTMPEHPNVAGRPSFIVIANVQKLVHAQPGPYSPQESDVGINMRKYNSNHHIPTSGTGTYLLDKPPPTPPPFSQRLPPPLPQTHILQPTQLVIGFMTPYIPSGTLRQNLTTRLSLLPTERVIPPQIQLAWSLQLIDAAIHLHRTVGICHNGIKPDNILIDDDPGGIPADREEEEKIGGGKEGKGGKGGKIEGTGGRLWLIDFEQLGTYRYLRAPERFGVKVSRKKVSGSGNAAEGEKADIYSIGTIIWMLHENIFTFHHLGTKNLGLPLEFCDTPVHLREVLERCIDGDPRRRPTLEELRRVVAEGGGKGGDGDGEGGRERRRTGKRKRERERVRRRGGDGGIPEA